MGEFLRKYVSKRLLSLSEGGIARLMAAARQLGVRAPGGMEALAIFHQLIYDEWAAMGACPFHLHVSRWTNKNCLGRIEWRAVREASRQTLPRHTAVACWKHAAPSFVEQSGVDPVPKDRGAEQGDVDGPVECSITLAQVAGETRTKVASLQRQGALPWIARDRDAACDDFDRRSIRVRSFQTDPEDDHEVRLDPRHEVQVGGGMVEYWYLDDGDILCHPLLVLPFLDAFDEANAKIGAERNILKTEVLYYATQPTLEQHAAQWQLDQVRTKASVSLASDGTLTLGVATGSSEFVTSQLQRKTQVVKAMHERVQLCQDPQAEFILARESLGLGRVNHILRVHGHSLVERDGAAAAFDAVGRTSLERLFQGMTDEGHTQATLSAKEAGLGWREALDVARPAHLGCLVAVGPRVKAMIQSGAVAGLLPVASLERRLDGLVNAAETAFLATLDEIEKVKAEEFLRRAKVASASAWTHMVRDGAGPEPPAPRIAREVGEQADDEANENNGRGRRISAPQLQRELSVLSDGTSKATGGHAPAPGRRDPGDQARRAAPQGSFAQLAPPLGHTSRGCPAGR
jgi:hypothetical protein